MFDLWKFKTRRILVDVNGETEKLQRVERNTKHIPELTLMNLAKWKTEYAEYRFYTRRHC